MLRFSLRTLIAMVAAAAIACAALIQASIWMASAAWTVTVLVLSLAAVGAILADGPRRGFWTGFAVVGWVYVLALGPLTERLSGELLTTKVLDRLARTMPAAKSLPSPLGPIVMQTDGTYTFLPASQLGAVPQYAISSSPMEARILPLIGPTVVPPNTEFIQAFISVGQALSTLLFALVGALFGRFILARNDRLSAQPAARAESSYP